MIEERKEYYISLIKESFSLSEVCRKANITVTSGNFSTLKKIISEENIDIIHFKRNARNKVNCFVKRDINLYLDNTFYLASDKLKKRLLDEHLKEKECESCGLTKWLNEDIPLELHHIDGNRLNNNLSNIILLCPNCHAKTKNYCGKNILEINKRKCPICGKEFLSKKARYCSIECMRKGQSLNHMK